MGGTLLRPLCFGGRLVELIGGGWIGMKDWIEAGRL
jgi:hypothetical protein